VGRYDEDLWMAEYVVEFVKNNEVFELLNVDNHFLWLCIDHEGHHYIVIDEVLDVHHNLSNFFVVVTLMMTVHIGSDDQQTLSVVKGNIHWFLYHIVIVEMLMV
jgi:hypothetical protein